MVVALMGTPCGVIPQLDVMVQACNPLGKWSQDSQEFPVSLGYVVSLKPAWAIKIRLCLKKIKNNDNNNKRLRGEGDQTTEFGVVFEKYLINKFQTHSRSTLHTNISFNHQ